MNNKCVVAGIFLGCVSLLVFGCDDGDDSKNGGTVCSEALCKTWCFDMEWGGEPGNEWGKREVGCGEGGACLCRDYPCDDGACNAWCVSDGDSGAVSGHCDIFACMCE